MAAAEGARVAELEKRVEAQAQALKDAEAFYVAKIVKATTEGAELRRRLKDLGKDDVPPASASVSQASSASATADEQWSAKDAAVLPEAVESQALAWGAQREMKDQRMRAAQAETKAQQLAGRVKALERDLAAAVAAPSEREVELTRALEDAKASAQHDRERAERAEREVAALRAEIARLKVANERSRAEEPPVAEGTGEPAPETEGAHPAPAAVSAEAGAAAGVAADNPRNKRERALKKKEEKAKQQEQQVRASVPSKGVTAPTAASVATAAAVPEPSVAASQAQLAARLAAVEEQRKLQEEMQAERLRQEEEERREREEEERNRRLQREEDEAREARKAQEKLALEEAERQRSEERSRRAAEKRRLAEEQEKRLAEEKKTLPPEDFAALQMMRAEVQPDAELSPGEPLSDEEDEDALLSREIRRVQQEEQALKECSRSKPVSNLADALLRLEGVPALPPEAAEQMKKAQTARQRAALKEKLQVRRELATIVGSTGGRRGRR